MGRYIIRRLLWGILLLIIVSALTFVFFRILPVGDPARLRAGRNPDPRVIADIRHNLGLDKPLLTQFWIYMKDIFLHFDLGYSYYSSASVKSLIFDRLPATISLAFGGAICGSRSASRSGSSRRAVPRHVDSTARAWAPRWCCVSAPEYWLGLIALYLFASGHRPGARSSPGRAAMSA